ncbi:MAG: peptide deformylase [Candidatus Paceibacterota bacterium]
MKEGVTNNIVQRDDPVLRNMAKDVSPSDIGSPHLNKIIETMKTAMHSQKDGVALAAPQIGKALKIFIINGELLQRADKDYKGDSNDLVFINPKIIRLSKEKSDMEEGCLSVRWLYGEVKRSNKVTLKSLNEKGEKIERGASGLLAQIFQHECDHLEGILFTDKASKVWEMTDEEIRELQNPNDK